MHTLVQGPVQNGMVPQLSVYGTAVSRATYTDSMLVFLKLDCRLSFCCGRFGAFCSALELLTRLQRLLVVWKLLALSFVGVMWRHVRSILT
jgi:hypothetical protein